MQFHVAFRHLQLAWRWICAVLVGSLVRTFVAAKVGLIRRCFLSSYLVCTFGYTHPSVACADTTVVVGNSLRTTPKSMGLVTIPVMQLTTRGSGGIVADPAKPSYSLGETVTLTAIPSRFYAFSRWSDGTIKNPHSISVSATNDYVAVFTNTVPLELRVARRWEGTFGGTEVDDLKVMRVLPDGSLLLGGTSDSGISGNKAIRGFGGDDLWLVKADSNGNRVWEKTFGGLGHDNFRAMAILPDGSILLGGNSLSNKDGNRSVPSFGSVDVWLIKLDANGNKIWDKAFGGSHYDDVYAIHALSEGGCLLVGSTLSPADGNKSSMGFGLTDGWLVKVGADGNKRRDRTFGGSGEDWFTSIQPTREGGFLLGGVSQSRASGNKDAPGLGNADMWLVKVDAGGSKIWDKTYGGTNFDVLNAMAATPDGGFLLGGASGSEVGPGRSAPISGLLDYWLVKVDAEGGRLWDKSYGGMSMDELSVIRPVADGGFLLGGSSSSIVQGNKTAPPYGGEDYWVIRIDAQGAKLWDRSFGGKVSDSLRAIEPTLDGGFMIGGTSESGIGGNKTSAGFGSSDFWALKILPEEWPVGTPWVEVNGNSLTKHAIPASHRAAVTVSTTFAGGHVFYTTDGTEPDAGSSEYTGPFEVTADRTVRAVAYTEDFLTSQLADPVVISFIPLYPFALTSTGGGTVTSEWAGGLVLSNTVVTLTATPSNGWTFVGWSGDATGTQNPLAITVRSNTTVAPIFGTPLTVSAVGGGKVLPGDVQSFYPFGSKVRLSAVPDAGRFFRFWTGAAAGLSNSPIVMVVTNPTPSVSAVFATLSSGSLALNTLVVGEGTVVKSPQLQNYAGGSTVTLTAVPSAGNFFSGWSGDASGTSNPLEVSMTATKTVTATFVSETRGVTIRSPFDGVELAAPANVAIEVTLVDFAAERVEFFQGTTKIGETSTAPFGLLWNPVEPGSYTLTAKATDASGFSNVSKPVNVKVSIPPAIRMPPQGQAVAPGANVEFSVVADGTPPLFYQWRTNGVDIPGATSSRYALTTSSAMLGSTSYTVLVTNSVGRALSGTAMLTVSALPPQTITFEPLTDRVLDNTTLSLVATASSGLPVGFSLVSGPARLTNSTLHLSGAGTVVLRASQPGNASVAPAQNVERSFVVTLGAAESGILDQGTSIAVVPYASAISDVQYAIERGPSAGAVVVNGNRFVFTPPASFYGLTDFTYRITDPVSGVETPAIRVNLLVRRVEPVYTLERSTYSAGEGDGVVTVTIHKNVSAEGRVLLTTRDVTAQRVVGGVGDYALQQTSLDFASGETSRSVAISLVDDLAFEGNEVFEFEIAAAAPSAVVAPSKATVTIADNDSSLVSFDARLPDPLPTRDARLQITLNPAGVDGGWRFLGQRQWNASGVTTDGLPEGDYEVEFKPANGFAHPLPVVIRLRSASTLNHSAYYVATPSPKLGNLTVTCAGTSFGGWKFVEEPDTAYRPSGTTVTALNVGTYTVQFKPVDGLIAPGNLNVEVRFQTPQTYEGTYRVAPVSTTDRIKPSVTSLALMKYPWVGQISRGDGALGTGFVVKDRVVVTAGHVLFDPRTLSNAKRVRWHFQKQRGTYEPKPQTPRGWSLYAGYAAQRSAESGSSTASPTAQNLDAAVLFFTESAGRGGYGGYLASTNVLNEWLVSTDEKMLTGYPIDGIPSLDQGKIHETSPVPVGFAKVSGLSEGWLYSSSQLLSYPGNSGGPICVRHANGSFYPAGVFVALDADRIYARSLDSKLVDMILAAEVSSLSATNATGGGVISPGTGGGVVNLAREDMIDDYGFLRVAISPTAAALLGGWRLVGGSPEFAQASLDPTPLLTYGYEIEYKPVAGYLTPPNMSVQLVSGVTNDIVALYTAVGSTHAISGTVGYYNSSLKVPGVVMSLTGDATATTTTGADGTYSFTVPAAGRYSVSPAKTTETPPVQGVSTLDIHVTRRQVLGLTPLDSAFKLLAADVNGSSTVTNSDITLMRRLILGLSDTLPGGLWRFVKSDQTFPDIHSPWGAEASRSYASLTADLVAQDFVAIKSGDVNASWTLAAPSFQGSLPYDPSSVGADDERGITLRLPELEIGLGSEQTIDVPLNASFFKSVTSLQCSMSWDPKALELVDTLPGRLPSVSEEHFNLMDRLRGWIAFSWDDPNGVGVSLGETDPLFYLRFRVKLARPGLATVFIGAYPTSIEITANSRVVASRVSSGSLWVGMKPSGLRFEIRHRGDDGLALVCPPLEGAIYVVQASDDLEAPVWRAVGEVQGDAADRSIPVEVGATRSRFYRFLVRPKVLLSSPGALIEMR